jgi:transposase
MIKRRHHPLGLKQQVVAESSRRGTSLAGVALAHGLNVNPLRKWRRDLLRLKSPTTRNALVPVNCGF